MSGKKSQGQGDDTQEILVGYMSIAELSIEEMILGKLKTKQALFDETIDSLATFASGEILFGVYEDLLKKYNLRPSGRSGHDSHGHPLS